MLFSCSGLVSVHYVCFAGSGNSCLFCLLVVAGNETAVSLNEASATAAVGTLIQIRLYIDLYIYLRISIVFRASAHRESFVVRCSYLLRKRNQQGKNGEGLDAGTLRWNERFNRSEDGEHSGVINSQVFSVSSEYPFNCYLGAVGEGEEFWLAVAVHVTGTRLRGCGRQRNESKHIGQPDEYYTTSLTVDFRKPRSFGRCICRYEQGVLNGSSVDYH